MLRSIIDKIKAIPAFLGRIRNEPVALAGLAMMLLTAYQEASTAGLGTEDLLIFVAQAFITWLGRELVVPTAKIEGSANFREPKVEAVYTGEQGG